MAMVSTRLVLSLGALVAGVAFSSSAAAQNCASPNPADWPAAAKPYFMLVVDTSGSMIACSAPGFANDHPNSCASNAPRNSCNMEPTRINDAKCALRNTVQAFAGQVNFGLATFSRTLTGCNGAACVDSCTTANGSNCADANNGESYLGNGCSLGGSSCGPSDMDCNSGAEPASPPN
ncbi:MAG: VWA domain-containing protein, partial [Polyangiaceae bacterium]